MMKNHRKIATIPAEQFDGSADNVYEGASDGDEN